MEAEPGPHMGLDGEDEEAYRKESRQYVVRESEPLNLLGIIIGAAGIILLVALFARAWTM